MKSELTAWDHYLRGTDDQHATSCLMLGPWTSYSLMTDPKHMSFVLARYKFCAKLLEGKNQVLEIGCGDGFGVPIVAQSVGHVDCVDWDQRLIEGNRERLHWLKNVEFQHVNVNYEAPTEIYDAAFAIDVLEHLDPDKEEEFMRNTCLSLHSDGMLIHGTPNITASQYASPQSEEQHINLKSHKDLKSLMLQYFKTVLMFSMNDEVIHTGYGPMGHYLFAVGIGKNM